jgi:hypothetical protein
MSADADAALTATELGALIIAADLACKHLRAYIAATTGDAPAPQPLQAFLDTLYVAETKLEHMKFALEAAARQEAAAGDRTPAPRDPSP